MHRLRKARQKVTAWSIGVTETSLHRQTGGEQTENSQPADTDTGSRYKAHFLLVQLRGSRRTPKRLFPPTDPFRADSGSADVPKTKKRQAIVDTVSYLPCQQRLLTVGLSIRPHHGRQPRAARSEFNNVT